MFVGNVCYVTTAYNECKFQLLLENHLSQRKGSRLSNELIEQCIAAYLACKDSDSDSKEVSKMEKLLNILEINYSDHRSYSCKDLTGNPKDAVIAFNQLANDLARKTER